MPKDYLRKMELHVDKCNKSRSKPDEVGCKSLLAFPYMSEAREELKVRIFDHFQANHNLPLTDDEIVGVIELFNPS